MYQALTPKTAISSLLAMVAFGATIGCSSGYDTPAAATTTPVTSAASTRAAPVPTNTPSSGADAPDASTTSTTGPATSARATTIQRLTFETPITVEAGATVTWTNADGEPHTVTAVDGSFTSDVLQEHQAYSRAFESPGRFEYYCTIHTLMTGAVIVE